MVVATAEGSVLGGALALRNDNGTLTLRIVGMIPASVTEVTDAVLPSGSRRSLTGSARTPSPSGPMSSGGDPR